MAHGVECLKLVYFSDVRDVLNMTLLEYKKTTADRWTSHHTEEQSITDQLPMRLGGDSDNSSWIWPD